MSREEKETILIVIKFLVCGESQGSKKKIQSELRIMQNDSEPLKEKIVQELTLLL